MYRRWKESEWGRASSRVRDERSHERWVGGSFDVGLFLGVDVLDQDTRTNPAGTSRTAEISSSRNVPLSTRTETFVTSPSRLSIPGAATKGGRSSRHDEDSPLQTDESRSAHSSTALIFRPTPGAPASHSPHVRFEQTSSSNSRNGHSGEPGQNGFAKGKGKAVHNPEPAVQEDPAPPREVLSRSGEQVEHTSAGAAQQADPENQVKWGNVIMRDRMLVKFSHTEGSSLPAEFDENANRTTSHLYNEDWVEYIVVWRKDRLELYRDHLMPWKDWSTGHKKLLFVIPLGSSTTRLSLYSFVDLTFCIVCPSVPLRHRSKRRWLYGQRTGLNAFVFKMKSRTRAIDWLYKLWRHLGGQLPPFLEIRSPILDTRIKIDIPDSGDVAAAYAVFNKQNIIRTCQERLKQVAEYSDLLEHTVAARGALALAWRSETNLDWVWQLEDVQGSTRDWAILCGLALHQAGKPAHLEVRLKEHYPTRLHLKDGTRLDEPPAVEGYLDRIRPSSQLKQAIYLTSHDGYLFSLHSAHAHHPAPPGFLPVDCNPETLQREEVHRGAQQILHAFALLDLRSIVAVRRAFQVAARHSDQIPGGNMPEWEDVEGFWEDVERSESDDEDAGGETGANASRNRTRLHMRRSFELLLTTGSVVRFEAYSCQNALEWIVRLRPLVSYWKKRHQVDARREMDLAYVRMGRTRITPLQHVVHEHDSPEDLLPDPAAPLPELSSFYNWCVMDGCRPMLKCGKLYASKGLHGRYKHIQMILTSGTLIQYRIAGRRSLHRRRHKMISLMDASVVSGYLAAQYLPEGQYDPDAPHDARRYQDGLETDDGVEDTLFMIWYRSSKKGEKGIGDVRRTDIPPLSIKRKMSVFRTRSRLERDAWVWAINVEIERVIRETRDREESIREAGNIVKTW
ncbi:uncharacterized protein LAESUDRAFT_640838 [Laetiporus sulphureus 93-53]|uniref:Uncharacterized protein n=1 Tax=Laetiporus sulphureus 93-53 TaxID=1314785 RepID=A0A165HQW6_9APHY|nr:uncharacterized protein LAESUDRAFT_640838 [Laetiporus sulphureus 93-53]KZT12064.1 hypothetical protein LAESUDRAFT_640838 [Laetiporus sulphureus 93-53]